ncbi:MAG: hypothetical protein VB102_02325 [Paludibacter sp.]|nr:hypothetical protein [Paludibacter sp.]
MKQKSLLLSLVLCAGSLFSLSAQEVLLSENFSTQEWETELARLNPGANIVGTDTILINKQAKNRNAYVTPEIDGTAYTSLNQGFNTDSIPDLYFGKYRLVGAIEVKAVMTCALGTESNHDYNQKAVGFRIQNTGAGMIEFPELESVGDFTIHVRNGNSTNTTKLGLEKFVDGVWSKSFTFNLKKNSDLVADDVQDEVLAINLDSLTGPVKLRLINNVAATKRFINLYGFEIKSRTPSAVGKVVSNPFKIAGRRLTTETPVDIAIYNTLGAVVFEQKIQDQIEIPATVGNGVFVVKSALGTQKLILK